MAYIKPRFNLTSNSAGVTTDPGPYSVALALSTTPTADTSGRLTVDLALHRSYTTTSSPVQILDGHDIMTENGSDIWTPGSIGGFLYMKNMDTAGTDSIYIGIVSNVTENDGSTVIGADGATAPSATAVGHLADVTNTTLRTMTLKPGEFAFFPWDYTGDVYVENNAGDPVLEYWLFDRA